MIYYGYARISTPKQKLQRQVDNIKKEYPNAIIIEEKFTGTTLDRPAWNNLYKTIQKQLEKGEEITLIFDEVSRMSRNAQNGFELYEKLYNDGVHLVFLKERHLDTDVYSKTLEKSISLTGTDVDVILKGINEYLMILAKRQIEIAFQTAQHEVDYLHQRTSEGIRKAQAMGKQIGRLSGVKIETQKSKLAKKEILKYSKDFEGSLSDVNVIKIIGISRNTYYKYKRELLQNLTKIEE